MSETLEQALKNLARFSTPELWKILRVLLLALASRAGNLSKEEVAALWPAIESVGSLVSSPPEAMSPEDLKTARSECYECSYMERVPGNCHIKCTEPDPEMTGDPHGIKKGWFYYPELFDPVWKLKKCSHFEFLKPLPEVEDG